jgi:plastocyanin
MTEDGRRPGPRESLLWPVVIPLGVLAVIGLVLWGFSRVLLHVEPHVATATALVVAVAIVAIVAWVASRPRVGNGALLSVAVGVAGVGMLASGAALLLGAPTEEGGEAVAIPLVAPAGAATEGFQQDTLTAPSDQPFVIEFDNQDPGVQHNVVVASDDPAKDPNATTLLTGEAVVGPAQAADQVPALPEGSYYFYCEFHPTTMTGTLTAAPGVEPGGGGGGPTTEITASGLAFDTSTITLLADQKTELTFNNEDAGVPHNLAIYTDESATDALFKGDIVTGIDSTTYQIPPLQTGSYYFHCDVHPDMNGTVTVQPGGGGPPPSGAAPPPSGAPTPASGAPPPSGSVTLTASGLAFDQTAISLPAGAGSSVTLDNQDTSVPHNFSIYTDDTATTALFQGDPVTGVATKRYEITPLDPGTYYFRCDIHPDSMHGSLTVG